MKSIQQLIDFRRELHRYPELSGQEQATARRVIAFLNRCQPQKIWEGIGGSGLVALFDSGAAGPCILLRAELDALPITEVNAFAHRSTRSGIAHKCGHDGHTTILLGLAEYLRQRPLRSGKLLLLFQPAEETGVGAKAMLADAQWDSIPAPDYVFALHNLPGVPLGQVIWREGAISAAVRSMIIRFYGKTAHAAEPEHGHNPTDTLALVLPQLQQLSNNELQRADFKVITPVHITVGEKAYGVAAGYGELHLTIRSWTEAVMEAMISEIKIILAKATKPTKIRYEIDWTDTFLGNTNDREATQMLLQAAKEANLKTEHRATPLKWGEDFGYFTHSYRGAFIGLGAGENTPALHNPDYDFPDALLEKGIALWRALLQSFHMH